MIFIFNLCWPRHDNLKYTIWLYLTSKEHWLFLTTSVSNWPTSQPSESPSISTQPSSQPSSPPSSIPSQAPSISDEPSSMPSKSPSLSTQPSQPSSQPSANLHCNHQSQHGHQVRVSHHCNHLVNLHYNRLSLRLHQVNQVQCPLPFPVHLLQYLDNRLPCQV